MCSAVYMRFIGLKFLCVWNCVKKNKIFWKSYFSNMNNTSKIQSPETVKCDWLRYCHMHFSCNTIYRCFLKNHVYGRFKGTKHPLLKYTHFLKMKSFKLKHCFRLWKDVAVILSTIYRPFFKESLSISVLDMDRQIWTIWIDYDRSGQRRIDRYGLTRIDRSGQTKKDMDNIDYDRSGQYG